MARAATERKTTQKTTSASLSAADRKKIEDLAYRYFAERGFEHGHDQEDWLKAEAVIRAKRRS